MSELDLRHLRIFVALCAARNVTRAAEAVGLSQSSVSVVLAQLRDHYGDPLFVRTAQGMQPTPRAKLIEPVLRQALQLLDQSLVRPAEFNPAEITRSFRICMTDVGQMTLLPRLLPRIHALHPTSESRSPTSVLRRPASLNPARRTSRPASRPTSTRASTSRNCLTRVSSASPPATIRGSENA
jgi:DNA-binding transcriptional LysR family regulator